MINRIFFVFLVFSGLSIRGCKESQKQVARLPKIVFIYLDDLGYGDVSAYYLLLYKWWCMK